MAKYATTATAELYAQQDALAAASIALMTNNSFKIGKFMGQGGKCYAPFGDFNDPRDRSEYERGKLQSMYEQRYNQEFMVRPVDTMPCKMTDVAYEVIEEMDLRGRITRHIVRGWHRGVLQDLRDMTAGRITLSTSHVVGCLNLLDEQTLVGHLTESGIRGEIKKVGSCVLANYIKRYTNQQDILVQAAAFTWDHNKIVVTPARQVQEFIDNFDRERYRQLVI